MGQDMRITDIEFIPSCPQCRADGSLAKVNVRVNGMPLKKEIAVIQAPNGQLQLRFHTRPDGHGQMRLGLIRFDECLRQELESHILRALGCLETLLDTPSTRSI